MRIRKLFIIVALAFAAFPAMAMQPMQSSEGRDTHAALAQQADWLNTSRAITADDLKGRIVLLDFWTYCCINCMHVIPDLHALEEKYGEQLTVIGVHSAKFTNEQDSENIRQAMLRYDITHPVVNDADFAIWKAFDANAWPTFVLLNPQGEVAGRWSGEGHYAAMDAAIGKLAEQSGANLNTTALPMALERDKAPRSILSFPAKLDIAPDVGGAPMLFVSDSAHHRILGLRLDGAIALEIGSGEQGLQDGGYETARFHSPQGVLWDAEHQTLYVADTENHALRGIDFAAQQVYTMAGDGEQGRQRALKGADALTTRLASPWDLAFYPDAQHITIAMAGTHQLWLYDRAARKLSVLAGNGRESIDDGTYPSNSLSQPSGLSVAGENLYFVDSETSSLRRMQAGRIKTLIGTGLFDFGYKQGGMGVALMQHPLGVATGKNGAIYVADSYNHAIRRYDPKTEQLGDFAGTGTRGDADGQKAQAQFNEPNDVAEWKGKLYVADTNNHRIRVIDADTGEVTSLALKPLPSPVAYDPDLPQTLKLEAASIRPTGTTLGVMLDKGWKLNEDAPSYLALFRNDSVHAQEASFDREQLKNGVVLPDLQLGAEYVLQGTLYYCEDKEGSVCLIKSVEQELTAADDGERALLIDVK